MESYFLKAIQSGLNRLPAEFQEVGLAYHGLTERDSRFGLLHEYLYINPRSGRTLSLIVNTTKPILLINIAEAKDSEECFDLDTYLWRKGLVPHGNPDDQIRSEESEEAYAKRRLDSLKRQVSGPLSAVLMGAPWEKIPFDWTIAGR